MYLHQVKNRHSRRQAGEITVDCLAVNRALQQQCFFDFPPLPLSIAETILAHSLAAVDINREFTDGWHESKKEEETARKRASPIPFLRSSFPTAAVTLLEKKIPPLFFPFFPLLFSHPASPNPWGTTPVNPITCFACSYWLRRRRQRCVGKAVVSSLGYIMHFVFFLFLVVFQRRLRTCCLQRKKQVAIFIPTLCSR